MALKRNLIANYLGQGWSAIMGLAFIPVYINYLGIEAYGLIGLFAVLQAWLSLLDMGMTPTLSREMARFTGGGHSKESIRDLLRSIEIIAVSIAVLIAGGVSLGANWIATDWLRSETLSTEVVSKAFAIMGLVTALRFVEGVYRSTIFGLQRQVLFNVINCLMATLRGLGAVGILIWVSPTIEAFIIWQGIVSIATLFIFCITTYSCMPRGERSGRFSIDALRSVWRFAGGVVLGTLTGLLITSVDKVFISKYLSLSDVGYYTLAGTIVSILGVLLGPINQAVFPRFAELMASNNRTALINTFLNASHMISASVGSIAIVIIIYSQEIIFLWSGNAQLAAATAPVVTVLGVIWLISSPVHMLYQAQLAHSLPLIGVKINLITIILTFPIYFYAVPIYGKMGAAYALLVAGIIGLVLHSYYTFKLDILPCFTEWLYKSIFKPIALSLTIGLAASNFKPDINDPNSSFIFIGMLMLLMIVSGVFLADRLRGIILIAIKNTLFKNN
jgi:O-antigen/teichoic acid export membrane protein